MKHLNIHIEWYELQNELILWPIDTIVNHSDRIAIVGENGAGKTTFLRIIMGQIPEYRWTIENIGAISLGYLEQIHFLDETRTVRDDLRDAFTELRELEQTIERADKKMQETGEYEEYTDAVERYTLLGGYTYGNEIERVARWIGIYHLLDNHLSEVSGWERTKIALAKVLLSRPDFLLLDEPTNFIDLQSVEWLEKYLQDTWKGGYMIISHDREFLDRTCSIVLEVRAEQGIDVYHGNYSEYVAEKRKRHEKIVKQYEEQQVFLSSEKTLINRFRAWSRAWFAKSRERALEKVELIQKPESFTNLAFQFEYTTDPTHTIVSFEDVFIGRKEPLFYIRDIALEQKKRVGIVGENGVGKSTLLKTILWKLPILDGLLNRGKWLDIGYYSQMHEELLVDKTIYENFELHGLGYSRERLASILGHYGFSYHDVDMKVSSLSGGQRSKILFAILGQKGTNFLILDEPTNHLDYESREALETALRSYPGTILFISHDRYFVNKLATHIWIIEKQEMTISYGNYEDYQYKKERGLSYDMSLFDETGELNLVLEEKLWREEARRIRDKFARKRR